MILWAAWRASVTDCLFTWTAVTWTAHLVLLRFCRANGWLSPLDCDMLLGAPCEWRRNAKLVCEWSLGSFKRGIEEYVDGVCRSVMVTDQKHVEQNVI